MKSLSVYGMVLFSLAAMLPLPNARAGMELKSLRQFSVDARVLDIATSPDGKTAFLLTPGKILVYDVEENDMIASLEVDRIFEQIACTGDDVLMLSAGDPSTVTIVKFDSSYDIDISGHSIMGAEDAPVTLVIFDDYQCPFCSRLDPYVKGILTRFPDQVRFVVKQFPLSSHKYSLNAAMAALAAGDQGRFWEFHSRLLENHDTLDDAKIQSIAEGLSLDMARFNKDLSSAVNRELVQRDIEEGKSINVTGTPSLFLNGKRVDNHNVPRLPLLIQQEIAKAASLEGSSECNE